MCKDFPLHNSYKYYFLRNHQIEYPKKDGLVKVKFPMPVFSQCFDQFCISGWENLRIAHSSCIGFKHRQKRGLWNHHLSHHFHTFFAFTLLFQ